MLATVGKWGNNLAVRLPGDVAISARLRDGDRVDISTANGVIVIRPANAGLSLDDMFRGKSAEAWRAEYAGGYDWGPDLGREIVPE